HFISAVEETVYKEPKTRGSATTWKYDFLQSYEKFYGKKLDIPRWIDIEDDYVIKKVKKQAGETA
ncbi:MAG: NgoBV family restriction endonuclease, partial [Victivallales bacterium]|nr:NgoBV family restriction endonuclease [Victivallales bacterium]